MKTPRFKAARRLFGLRYTWPVLAACIMTFGPALLGYIALKTAPHEAFEDGAALSMVPTKVLTKVGRMKRPSGMGPWQFACYIRACEKAGISPQRITQTIGNYVLSAGTHARDGYANEDGSRYAYSCAIDISVRGLNQAQIKALVQALADAGFAAWYRHTGSFAKSPHIHAVFVGYPMKASLRAQVADYVRGLTGLVGHRKEAFYQPTTHQKRALKLLFEKRNSFPVKVNVQGFRPGEFMPGSDVTALFLYAD